MTAHTHRRKGFTLIELVIVIIVLSIMAAVLAPTVRSSLLAYDAVLSDVVVLDKLRYATERLAREIREVNAVTDANGNFTSFNFTTMGASAATFTRTYYNSDGSVLATNVVRICAIAPNLRLSYGDATLCSGVDSNANGILLTDDLSALAFKYYDKTGTEITTALPDPVNVRAVEISLTLTPSGSPPYTQTTRVELKRYSGT